MHRLFIDIETIAADWDDDTKAAAASAGVPSNYKDPAKIAEWAKANADKVHRSTSLDPLAGRILCIGYAYDDEPVRVAYDATGAEAGLFNAVYAALVGEQMPTWVGHNLAAFDAPWIFHHARRAKHALAGLVPFKKYDHRIEDTMLIAAGSNPRDGRSLADLCAFYGIEGKGDLDGSKVYDAWLAGEHDKISRYCAQDVEMTRQLHAVLTGATVSRVGSTP